MASDLRPVRSLPAAASRSIPEATVARLPVYHQVLSDLANRGVNTISSDELAAACAVTSAKLRKDLSFLGSYGTRGVGYDVEFLRYHIARELGTSNEWNVVIVGYGNLGHALAQYRGFGSSGFRVVAVFDEDKNLHAHASVVVHPMSELETLVPSLDVHIGVIATPASSAQEVCDRLIAAGISSILNFAPAVLNVPGGVEVRNVDLAVELQILAFHEQRRLDVLTNQVVHA